MTVTAAFFYLFAAVTVASAFMVIASRNPVHSVLFLILAFVNAAGLFLLMGAEFLAMILVVVYVGAVAVLFLFVVMMLDVDFAELRAGLPAVPADRRADRRCLPDRARSSSSAPRRSTRASSARPPSPIPAADVMTNTEALGQRALHPVFLLLPGRRPDPAGRHDRRHRADPARAARRQAPGHLDADRPHAGDGRRGAQGSVPRKASEETRMVIGLSHYLTVAAILFTLGVFGIFLNRKNVIVILMSIELILLAVNINFVAFSTHLNDIVGQVFALLDPHRRGRRGGDRPCHSRRLLPQPRLHRGRGHQHDEGLRPTARGHVSRHRLPAARRLPHRRPVRPPASARAPSEVVTTALLFVAGAAVLDRVLPGRLRRGRDARPGRAVDVASGDLVVDWAFRIDTLTAVMLVVVNTVSALVHLYSIGYMHEDPHRPRFFAYLSLFTFAMLMLVTADNLVQMFFGWEGVGLASYLLIGFWYQKAVGQRGGHQGLHRQPRRRFRLRARHLPRLRAVRLASPSTRSSRASASSPNAQFPLPRHRLARADARLPAAVHGRHGQVGAVPAAHLAAGRHGGPDPGLGADPRRHHGDGRRVHGGAPVAALRVRADGAQPS